ncbi:FAD:protein FMN transferase [Saccharospirillum impatiens]|uniref:FAD:protein FMN transferase n=1 Tax=Saccharospirillum impatiens TaxID=169438 RepID=UPI000424922A|nr:FAD:protein FMN transferase [Saccharospirillum impatiens]
MMPAASQQPRLRHFEGMGGPCDLAVFEAPESFLDLLEAEVVRLELRYSRYRQDSLVSVINSNAGTVQGVDAECAGLLNYADHCYWLSDGLFDVTAGVLRRVWDFKQRRVPGEAELASVQSLIGWERVAWDGQRLQLAPGMELDFGGIVKEFAADRLVTMMNEAGYSGMANLAGDIAVTGPQPDGQPWLLGVRDPGGDVRAMARVALNQGGLASSGDYERGFTHQGVRYSHILNPNTGWPVEQAPRAVTVIADHCIMAGSLATIAMLKGKDAESWLVALDVPFLLCNSAGKVSGTLAAPNEIPND